MPRKPKPIPLNLILPGPLCLPSLPELRRALALALLLVDQEAGRLATYGPGAEATVTARRAAQVLRGVRAQVLEAAIEQQQIDTGSNGPSPGNRPLQAVKMEFSSSEPAGLGQHKEAG